ncbi:helix-turn-helix domain-containing protein [Aneurinibacillus thermoaerophilus]|uniref:helix-turn-helix domain-containing protein n=1 Tax=Aneurinibacillus thermoaerophilus TaxID=143495 RepID=UPI002E1DFC23|nr:helix-turn-helix domain-containing protein [Aneurinibacillus thermoaerophilus]MED0680260.1 helix-turn-helix domain-containing protein [Aneurinibacillus thermoaerophilus]MED0766152.1 helix-turn-helix domain-containing protein [Aneurinibacillus thermoaerophilus]
MTQPKTIQDYPMILTAKEIAEILRVSKPTAYELMKRTDFPLLPFEGRIRRVQRDEFFQWLTRKSQNNTTA